MSATDQLTGAWKVTSFAFTDAGGGVYNPLGESPAGTVAFTPDGYMSFTFMASARAPFAAEDLFGGSEAERAAAAAGYVSFGGPYRVEDNAIVIDVEYSLFPNWVGKKQVRLFFVEGDRLTLRTPGPKIFNGVERTGEARLRRAGAA